MTLSEDEFRILAYIRAYADHADQSLTSDWVREQLEMSWDRFRSAARSLTALRLAEFNEWQPDDPAMIFPEYGEGPVPLNIKLTREGWDYLWIDRDVRS